MSLLLKNRYQVLEVLSEAGGFGQTFLAEDTDTPSRRRCVIKKLRPVADAEDFKFVQERFQREAAILERLGDSCDQIPKLYAYFVENQEFYLVQELIDGFTLKQKLQREGVLDENTVRGLLWNLLNVLEYVHAQNIIHRDIKPDNVILRHRDNKPVLIDFGIVKEVLRVGVDGSPTSSVMAGTPGYTASEQAAGRPVYSSDIYSLGATAIYLLTGKNPQQMNELATGDIAWQKFAPQVSSSFAAVINKATELHVRDRYKTNAEMREDLKNCSAIPEPPPSPPKPVEDPAPKPKPFVNPVPDVKPEIPPTEPPPDNSDETEILTEISTPEKPKRKWLHLAFPAIMLLLFAVIGSYWLLSSESKLIPFRKGDKFGYSDGNKNIIIEAKYDDAEPFYEGMAKVKLNDKYGFIGQNGKVLIPIKYDMCDFIHKPNVIDSFFINETTISPSAKKNYAENENLISVKIGDLFGLIDKSGKEIIPIKFEEGLNFSDNLITAKLNKKYGYIDKTGKVIIPFKYDGADDFIDGIAPVMKEGVKEDKSDSKWGFIDKTGKEIIPLKFESVGGTSNEFKIFASDEALISAKFNGKFGFIDKTGKEVIPFIYDETFEFINGLAGVMKKGIKEDKSDSKWGFIDKTGKEIIPLKYEVAFPFIKEITLAKLNGKAGYIDKSGNQIIPFNYDNLSPFGFIDGLALVEINGKRGFINKENNLVIEAKYNKGEKFDFIGPIFSEGLAAVGMDDKKGYIDKTGKTIIPFKYESAQPFANGIAEVTLNGKTFYIDKNGTEYYERDYLTEPVNSNISNISSFNQNGNLAFNTTSNSANSVTNTPLFNANNTANTMSNTYVGNANSAVNTSSNSSSKLPYYKGKTATLRTNMRLRSVPNDTESNDNIVGVHYKGAEVKILDVKTFENEGVTVNWIKIIVIKDGCDAAGKLGCGHEGAKEGWMNGKPEYVSLN